MGDWDFDLKLVQNGDPREIARVQRAMLARDQSTSTWMNMEEFITIPGRPNASREEKFVTYVQHIRNPTKSQGGGSSSGGGGGAAAASTGAVGAGAPPPPGSRPPPLDLDSSSSDEDLQRKSKGKRRRKEKEGEEREERRKKRKRERKERKDKDRKGKKKEKRKRKSSSSSDSSSSSSSEGRHVRKRRGRREGSGEAEVRPVLKLTKDRSPEMEDRPAVQHRIQSSVKLFFKEWQDWNEVKAQKDKLKKFHRDVRKAWVNGNEIRDGYINNQAKGVMKDHRYVLRRKLKLGYNRKTKSYTKPDGMDEGAFQNMVKGLTSKKGTPQWIKLHQGDIGSSARRKLVSNRWGQGGYPRFLGNFVSALTYDVLQVVLSR